MSAFASSTLEQHPTLYFPHGDIILALKLAPLPSTDPVTAATGTVGTRQDRYQVYRVHQFLLSRHSQVFANMFSDSAPGNSHEGVPVVEMIGDDPEVFSQMLSFLYGPS